MTKYSSPTIGDCPHDIVRMACSRCPRRGQYNKARLVAEYGADTVLPDLRTKIANCTGGITSGQWSACGAYFVDLVPPDK